MSFKFVGVLLAFVATAPAALAQVSDCDAVTGNLVANCGFESFDAAEWILDRNGGDFAVGSLHIRSGVAGAYVENETPYTTLAQSLQTTPGSTYEVSFYLRNGEAQATNAFRVLWEGAAVTTSNHASPEWARYSFQVQASSELSELTIGMGTGGQGAIALDDVVVVEIDASAAVAPASPVPATPLAFILALAAVICLAALRKIKLQ